MKYGHGMRIFQKSITKFLQLDVIRLISVVVMLLAFENFKLGLVLTKVKTFHWVFTQTLWTFFAIIIWIICVEIFTNFLKLGPKYLIYRCFSLKVFSSLSNQILRSRCNTPKRLTSWWGAFVWQWKLACSLLTAVFLRANQTEFYGSNWVDIVNVLIFEIMQLLSRLMAN